MEPLHTRAIEMAQDLQNILNCSDEAKLELLQDDLSDHEEEVTEKPSCMFPSRASTPPN